jgi:nucleoside-diphosphate-sugar epimerase
LSTKPHIVITGASGFIGKALVDYFHSLDFSVHALCRKIPKDTVVGVTYFEYDLEKAVDPAILPQQSIIIHCAYSQNQRIDDINEKGARQLLSAASQADVTKIIFFSSLSAQSDSGSYYATQKQKLELLFTAPHVVLRPGLVIGKEGLFAKTLQFIHRFHLLPIVGQGDQAIYFIGINDLLKISHALLDPKFSGVFYALHPNALSYREFYTRVAKLLQKKIMVIKVPSWLIRTLIPFYNLIVKQKITHDSLKGLQHVPQPEAKILAQSHFGFPLQSLEDNLTQIKW